jgi:hypothetical protein
MIVIRNPNESRSRTVIASEALETGMIVTAIRGTAKGEPLQVRKATAADLADVNLKKGIVDFIPDSDEAIDMIIDPLTKQLTVNTGIDSTALIPAGSQCVQWTEKPVVGYSRFSVDPSIVTAWNTIREPDLISVGADARPATGGADVVGRVEQHDGFEISVEFHTL